MLRAEVVGRIGCHDDAGTYVVPVIYAYDGEAVYVYSIEGRKIRTMRANPEVCFEVDRYDGPGDWRSAIAFGTYEELDPAGAERARALLRERFSAGSARPAVRRRVHGRCVPDRAPRGHRPPTAPRLTLCVAASRAPSVTVP